MHYHTERKSTNIESNSLIRSAGMHLLIFQKRNYSLMNMMPNPIHTCTKRLKPCEPCESL